MRSSPTARLASTSRHPEDFRTKHEPAIHQNDLEHLVQDRIGDLYATARELHPTRRDMSGEVGLLVRTRSSIGRRLVSLGHTVAGQGA